MAVSLKHAFTSAIPDGGDTSLVQPSNWNAEHTLTAGANTLLGAVTAGAVGEITCTAAGRALIDDADAAAQRTTLGLGTIATQASSNVSITGGSITGITDLAVADGGTGASTAANARTNLAAAGTGDANTFTANQIISVTDNTNAALRITQLGTGEAIRVEDSTNPDSTPFVVDASGNVGIGTATMTSKLNVVGDVYVPIASGIATPRASDNAFVRMLSMDTGTNTTVLKGGFGSASASSVNIAFKNVGDTTVGAIGAVGQIGVGGTNFGTSGQTIISGGSAAAPSWGTLGVAGGGTGLSSATAYALLAGGTTSTGAFQSLSTGTSGQVLTSGGSAALPSWSTVNSSQWVFVGTYTPSAVATLDVTGLSAYKALRITIANILPATNNVDLYFRLSSDNGSTFIAGTGYNTAAFGGQMDGAYNSGATSTGATSYFLGSRKTMTNTAGTGLSGVFYINAFNEAKPTAFNGLASYWNSGTSHDHSFSGGIQTSATAMNAIRILFSSGNITSGTVTVEGLA